MKKILLIVLFISVGFSQELIRGVDTDIYGNVKITYYKETQNQLEKVKEVGYYENGQKKYEGTLTLPCGEKYVGEFKDGKPNGQGTFTFSDGRKWVGEFRNDRPWNIIDYDKDGKIIGRYVNGEYIEKIPKTTPLFLVTGYSKEPIKNMVFVEGGTFQMGSNSGDSDEIPMHTVTVSSFYMDKTEVTQAEYRRVMGKNPSRFSGCDDCPVEKVSWHDANEYAKKVGKRLPTEAEWEYAARGGNKSKGYRFSGSNDIDAVGWYGSNSRGKTHPVAEKQPNELGLYDMSGNVWEWCSDWHSYYSSSPQTDPQGSNSEEFRVLHGGSWDSNAYVSRVALRYWYNPFNRYYYCRGFRLALSQDF